MLLHNKLQGHDNIKPEHETLHTEEVIIGTEQGTTFLTRIGTSICNTLIDTSATKSCISERYYQQLLDIQMQKLNHISVRSATGSNLTPLGIIHCSFELGKITFTNSLIVCRNLTQPLILGRDFLLQHNIMVRYAANGKCILDYQQQELIASIDIENEPQLYMTHTVDIPGRTLAIVCVHNNLDPKQSRSLYEIRPNDMLVEKYPNLCIIPMIHNVDVHRNEYLPLVIINFANDDVNLSKGESIGYMSIQPLEISETMTETSTEPSSLMCEDDEKKVLDKSGKNDIEKKVEKKFITSPADVDIHRKVELQDADISEEQRQAFRDLYMEFKDIFSTDSGDIGKTPLLKVEIDTGDSQPITQKPYTLPLKHTEWVQRELEILEKAGVIVRSVSPWASPIVVVPKRTAPGEPPKQRLCVDYRALNSLLPPVKKAFSKAKGILTLVPLPKIDEIYARLKGSNIYSTFDNRSGYYHMVLSEKSRPKSAFVSSFGKWEFKRCPFGLAQAPAYFQRLVNEVLSGLTFAFGYLDDILVYSPDMETHLEHLRKLFMRLREADLKLKEVKCNFLKRHIQYLGHIVSGKGITPMPEKLACIKDMPPPKTAKDVEQFLGLIGYYQKFIPRFSDLARPLNMLTRKDVPFE